MRVLTLVAVTHQSAPFAVLEQATLDPEAAAGLSHALCALPGVDEAAVLSTCNRTELYLAGRGDGAAAALDVLASHTGVPSNDIARSAIVLSEDAASLHLFRVAAGLESRVLGEGEILRQVRAAAARAARLGTAGPSLNDLFRWAAATGRRARRDAGGAARPSLARTALDAVPDVDVDGMTLVLGAGGMAAAVAAELRVRGWRYRVVARRVERAARLARRAEDAIDMSRLGHEIAAAALVVCATGARSAIVDRETVAAALAVRGDLRLSIIDLSMPRNVAADVAELQGVDLLHLQDLHGGDGDLQLRRSSDVVDAAHDRYRLWLAGRAAGPVIAALRERVTAACVAEAERNVGPGAAPLARRLAGRALHAPTLAVKELSARGDTAALNALAAALGVNARFEAAPVPIREAS